MKKSLLVALLVAACIGFIGINSSLASYTITFDDQDPTVAGLSIAGVYDDLGIDFLSDSTGVTDPAQLFFPSYIIPGQSVTDIFWYPLLETDEDDPEYPYPTTPYLAMDNTDEENKTEGVVIQFDYYPTQLAFKYRRPGTKERTGAITISFFDTAASIQDDLFSDQVTTYVYASAEDDTDGDGWLAYTSSQETPFNLVVITGDRKFAIDDLDVYTVPDVDGNYPEDEIPQGFNCTAYLAANADLPGTWTKPDCITHYKVFGFSENRAVAFNLAEYLNANPDLPTDWTYEEGLNHYNTFGRDEHRLLAFDAQEYLSLYSDLPQDWTYEQAFAHYRFFGKAEGRIASFDETAYLELYPDLPQTWGQAEAFSHYLIFGIDEGRVYDPYDEDVFVTD